MAKQLKRIFTPSVDQVDQTYTINAWHVSQSVDALTGADDYDITISGSLTITGSIFHAEIQDASGAVSSVLVRDNSTGEYYYTGSYSTGGGGSTDTGSLLLTASISNSTITFTKGDSTTFNITVDTGSDTNIANTNLTLDDTRILNFNGNDLNFTITGGESFTIASALDSDVSITNLATSSKPNIIFHDSESGQLFTYPTTSLPFLSDSDTGSFYYSSSVNLNTITFYQGDGTFETVIVNTGSGGGTGSTDYVSNVVYNTGSIAFTGVGSAFNSSINISDLTGSLVTTSSFNAATGSFLTTGSVSSNTITLTKGDGSTFNLTINTGSGGGGSTDYVSDVTYETGSIDFSGVGNAFTGSIDVSELTGSSLVTSSVSNNTITFTKGDGTTFNITVDTGSGGGGGSALTASDEGVVVDTDVTEINFTGEIVNVTQSAAGEVQVDFTPPGNTTEIIYNSASRFHATGSLTFDDSSHPTLIVDGTQRSQYATIKVSGSELSYGFIGDGLIFNSSSEWTRFGWMGTGNAFYFSSSLYAHYSLGNIPIPQANFYVKHANADSTPLVFAVGSQEISGAPQVDGVDDLGFAVNDLGKIFTPNLNNANQQHVALYNTASGEITYYTASAFGGGGGSTDYISNVAYNTGSIAFTGVGSAFNNSINISGLTGSLVTTSSFNTATGSFLTTGSVSNNTITFTKGDGNTFNLTVDTGSGGGGSVTRMIYTRKQSEGDSQSIASGSNAVLVWADTNDETNNDEYFSLNQTGYLSYDTSFYKYIKVENPGLYEISYQILMEGNNAAAYAVVHLERVNNGLSLIDTISKKGFDAPLSQVTSVLNNSQIYYFSQAQIDADETYIIVRVYAFGTGSSVSVGGNATNNADVTWWSVKLIE